MDGKSTNLFVYWIDTGGTSFEVAINILSVTGTSFVWINPIFTLKKIKVRNKLRFVQTVKGFDSSISDC